MEESIINEKITSLLTETEKFKGLFAKDTKEDFYLLKIRDSLKKMAKNISSSEKDTNLQKYDEKILAIETQMRAYRVYANMESVLPYIENNPVARSVVVDLENMAKFFLFFFNKTKLSKLSEDKKKFFYSNIGPFLLVLEEGEEQVVPVLNKISMLSEINIKKAQALEEDNIPLFVNLDILEKNLFGLIKILDIKRRMMKLEINLFKDVLMSNHAPWLVEKYLLMIPRYKFLYNSSMEALDENIKAEQDIEGATRREQIIKNLAEEEINLHLGMRLIETGLVLKKAMQGSDIEKGLGKLVSDWNSLFDEYSECYFSADSIKKIEKERKDLFTKVRKIEDSIYFQSKGEINNTPYVPYPYKKMEDQLPFSVFVMNVNKLREK